jgi:hypothetical protein
MTQAGRWAPIELELLSENPDLPACIIAEPSQGEEASLLVT